MAVRVIEAAMGSRLEFWSPGGTLGRDGTFAWHGVEGRQLEGFQMGMEFRHLWKFQSLLVCTLR